MNMNSHEWFKNVEAKGSVTLDEVSELNDLLHKEGKLPNNQAVRYLPLFGEFDIVNADFFDTSRFQRPLCYKLGRFETLKAVFSTDRSMRITFSVVPVNGSHKAPNSLYVVQHIINGVPSIDGYYCTSQDEVMSYIKECSGQECCLGDNMEAENNE